LNKYDKAEEYFGNLLHQLRSNDIDQLISLKVELGDISAKNSHLQQALKFYNEAIEIQLSSNKNPPIELANIHRKIGNISLNMGKKRKSLNNYLRAIEILNNHVHRNQTCLGLSFIDIGLYYTKNGQYQYANHYLKKAVVCLMECTPRRDNYLSLAIFYLGITYFYLKKYPEAIECHRNALFIYLATDMSYNRQYIKSVYYHLGLNYFRIEKYDKALSCFDKVIEKGTDMLHSAMTYYYMGSIYYQRGKYEQSLESYLVSLENIEDVSMKANVSYNIASIYMKMNLINNSIAFFDRAFKFELEFVSKKYPNIIQYYNHIQNVKDNCRLSNEVMREYHHELDIVTQLFESYNQTSTAYEVICFDPDNMSYKEESDCFRNLTRVFSSTQIIKYLRTCKTQIIFIIAYSNLNIQLNYMGKTIHIYLLKHTNDVVFGGNIRGCFNDIDHLLIELTNDIVMLGTNQSYNERRMNNQLVSDSNWREVYINRFEQISLKSVPVQEEWRIHRTYPKK
jgi:tetratricopeptide (TPR) repeat protein